MPNSDTHPTETKLGPVRDRPRLVGGVRFRWTQEADDVLGAIVGAILAGVLAPIGVLLVIYALRVW